MNCATIGYSLITFIMCCSSNCNIAGLSILANFYFAITYCNI